MLPFFKSNHFFCIFSIFLALISFSLADVEILYHKEVCDEAQFYTPYLRLLRTRQPSHDSTPILKLLSPGYVDVSKHTGILCINGPAIVYTDLMQPPTCDNSSSSGKPIPSSGEPQLFSHDCFSFNRLSRDAYTGSKEPREVTKDTQVFGNKIFGVYFLGLSPDYRQPTFHFLPRPDYGYPPSSPDFNQTCISDGASLLFMTNSSASSSHCYRVKKHNTDGELSVPFTGTPMFCFREDRDEDFDTPFHKPGEGLQWLDVFWTADCVPDNLPPSGPSSPISFMEQEPIQLPDFRIIDPSLWSSQGSQGVVWKARKRTMDFEEVPLYSKPNPPGSHFHDDPGYKDLQNIKPGSGSFPKGHPDIPEQESTTTAPYQRFEVQLVPSDCEEVPAVPENCAPDVPAPCTILNHVLTLEETDWKNDTMKDGSWRLPIFQTVNRIYERVCPQVAKIFASSVSLVFQYLLSNQLFEAENKDELQTEFKNPQRPEWTVILEDLKKCREKSSMITFFKKKDISALKLKKKLEGKLEVLHERIAQRIAQKGVSSTATQKPGGVNDGIASALSGDPEHAQDLQQVDKIQEHLNELPLKFPYKILIGTPGQEGYSGASEVFHYREAAEVDHEFDWAIDAFWKVVTTVLGYCYNHQGKKEAATFSATYDTFIKDFFKFVLKPWKIGENRPMYELVFGEFMYGSGSLWIDACHSGAYQWSQIVELRPLRPLPLTQGDVPPLTQGGGGTSRRRDTDGGDAGDKANKTPQPENFFLDNPIQDKGSVDHDYYYEESNKEKIPDQGEPEMYTLDTNTKIKVRNDGSRSPD